ncbi:MAG: GreA/GreB family elongation factor [Acetobacteraceae bacterium]
MSRAFVREPDADTPPAPLPEIPLPPPPNPVTARGAAHIEAVIGGLETQLSDAATPGHAELRRRLRYWTARRTTAQITPPPADPDEVGFGSRVTLTWPGRGEVTVEIVGEDESDPAAGRVSWRAPLAAALIGAGRGEAVEARLGHGGVAGPVTLTILAVRNSG